MTEDQIRPETLFPDSGERTIILSLFFSFLSEKGKRGPMVLVSGLLFAGDKDDKRLTRAGGGEIEREREEREAN